MRFRSWVVQTLVVKSILKTIIGVWRLHHGSHAVISHMVIPQRCLSSSSVTNERYWGLRSDHENYFMSRSNWRWENIANSCRVDIWWEPAVWHHESLNWVGILTFHKWIKVVGIWKYTLVLSKFVQTLILLSLCDQDLQFLYNLWTQLWGGLLDSKLLDSGTVITTRYSTTERWRSTSLHVFFSLLTLLLH